MRNKASALRLILKALRSGSKKLYKFGVRMISKGWITKSQIEAHDETRKATGMPPKALDARRLLRTKEQRTEEAVSEHTSRPHVVRRGGKLL